MIVVLTYDEPHRKTQDILGKLIFKGYKNIAIIATPFETRKSHVPIYQHRPFNAMKIELEELCNNLNLLLIKTSTDRLINEIRSLNPDYILIAGAGILPKEIVNDCKIINSHPGYLPNVKGLDSLKWAIFYEQPIGVTTHYVTEKTDEGLLIERNFVPVFYEDTFHSVAYRQYEMEVDMIINSVEILNKKTEFESLEESSRHRYEPRRRMPHHLEIIMMEKFNILRRNSPSFKSTILNKY